MNRMVSSRWCPRKIFFTALLRLSYLTLRQQILHRNRQTLVHALLETLVGCRAGRRNGTLLHWPCCACKIRKPAPALRRYLRKLHTSPPALLRPKRRTVE